MSGRDDMVITPRLKRRGETTPRERAKEERRTEREAKRRRRRFRATTRASANRRASISRARPRSPIRTNVRNAARGASRVLGAAAVFAETVIRVGQAFRQVEHGMSKRLIEAQDAHTIYGDLDEQFTAASNTRSFFESRPDLLRAARNSTTTAAGLTKVAEDINRLELFAARGADAIERDVAFDSPDTMEDKILKELIQKARESGVADKAATAIELIRKYVWFSGWNK